jgi:hypothetical protein
VDRPEIERNLEYKIEEQQTIINNYLEEVNNFDWDQITTKNIDMGNRIECDINQFGALIKTVVEYKSRKRLLENYGCTGFHIDCENEGCADNPFYKEKFHE